MQAIKNNKSHYRKYYGKLDVASMSNEIKHIWYNKDKEFQELPQCGWTWQQQTDMDCIDDIDYLKKLFAISNLNNKENFVLASWIDGASMTDISKELNVSNTRIGAILAKSLRKLRHFTKHLGKFDY